MNRIAVILFVAVLTGACAAGAPASTTPVATPRRSAAPTATPPAAPSASASPAPTATASPEAKLLSTSDKGRPLPAGTYRVGAPFARPFTVTFAKSWSLESLTPADVQFHYAQGGGYDGSPWLIIDTVENVFQDPCLTGDGPRDPPVAHTLDGVVAALGDMDRTTASEITSMDINGRAARAIEVTNSIDTDTTRCTDDRLLWLWTLPGGGKGPGTNGLATEHIWALDVDGAVVVLDGETYAITPQADRGGFEEVAKSLRFE